MVASTDWAEVLPGLAATAVAFVIALIVVSSHIRVRRIERRTRVLEDLEELAVARELLAEKRTSGLEDRERERGG